MHWTVPWLMTLRKVLVCLLCEMGVISQCEVMRGEGGIKRSQSTTNQLDNQDVVALYSLPPASVSSSV